MYRCVDGASVLDVEYLEAPPWIRNATAPVERTPLWFNRPQQQRQTTCGRCNHDGQQMLPNNHQLYFAVCTFCIGKLVQFNDVANVRPPAPGELAECARDALRLLSVRRGLQQKDKDCILWVPYNGSKGQRVQRKRRYLLSYLQTTPTADRRHRVSSGNGAFATQTWRGSSSANGSDEEELEATYLENQVRGALPGGAVRDLG